MEIYSKLTYLIKVCFYIIFLLIFLGYGQDETPLVSYFRAQSIPVEDIKVKDKSVFVKLYYRESDDSTEDKTKTDCLAIFRKIAEKFPNSEEICIQVFDSGELLITLIIETKDGIDYANGNIKDEDLISKVDLKEHLSLEKLMTSIMPDPSEYQKFNKKPTPQGKGKVALPTSKKADQTITTKTKSAIKKDVVAEGLKTDFSKKQVTPVEKKRVLNTESRSEGKDSYLGVQFTKYEREGIKVIGVIEDSPAEHAGLQKDDLILEIEENSFREKGYDPNKFAEAISKMPVDRPLRFHIERKSKKFDVWIKLRQIEKEELQDLQDDYEKGRQLMMQKDYSSAIEYFNKSIKSRPKESNLAIGVCYLQQGVHEEALEYIVKAYKMDKKSPRSTFYLAACCDRLRNTRDAIYYYKKYLKFKHDNPEMNSFSSKRLKELKNNTRLTEDTLRKIINAIIKEIK